MALKRMALKRRAALAVFAVATGAGLAFWAHGQQTGQRLSLATSAYAQAAQGDLFQPISVVLNHPRCMNCHPRDDRPRQGNDRHEHLQNVVRGVDDLGFVNMRCTSCHRDENNANSGVPGAPTWHLAPISMGWQGLGDAELCTTLKDEKRNGGKTVAALVEHMTVDKLVLWGWSPGGTRDPVSTPHDVFVTQLKAWEAAGAPCPAASK
ncbi:MAG: hypothetical protein ABL901_17540 [Hyphomicrobiaceae bacterium]